jgi:hypothetical protein
MRQLFSRQATQRTEYMLMALSLIFVSGCTLNPSRSDAIGTYLLKGQGANQITLSLSPDGGFSETIQVDGSLKSNLGTWSMKDGDISFDRLWIPETFAPASIVEADKQAGERHMPKYTEPGHWVIGVERIWGRMKMEVFPNDDVEFVMVAHP